MQDDIESRYIPGWSNRYSISEYGIVTSFVNKNPKILKWSFDTQGYAQVALTLGKGTRPKTNRVHKLVAITFIGPCPEGMQCRHLDGDQLNNYYKNLQWGTPYENNEDKRLHGTMFKTHCINGHEYTLENTVVRPGKPGVRRCKICSSGYYQKKS